MLTSAPESVLRHDALLLRVAHLVSTRDETRPGGALLGPRLFFLAAMERLPDERLIRLGTAVELLRRATIVHREPKAESAWAAYPPHRFSQTLRGDTLLSESFRLLAQDGEPRTVALLSRAMAGVSEGELEAHSAGNDGAEGLGDALCRRAAFFEGAAATGALLGGFGPEASEEYAAWGMRVGLCHERSLAGTPCSLEETVALRRCPLPRPEGLVTALFASVDGPDTY